jgi:hypothetical protein
MKRVASLLCLVSFLIVPHAAAAADGLPVEMSGGYSCLHDQDASSNFPGGWTASVSAGISSRLSVVGELGGSYQALTTPSGDVTGRIYSFLGGDATRRIRLARCQCSARRSSALLVPASAGTARSRPRPTWPFNRAAAWM